MVFRSRAKTITDTDLLSMDVGAVLEQGGYPGAANVGRPGFRPGYHLIVNRRNVQVCFLDNREGADLARSQKEFAERVGPMLSVRFGANRVRAVTLMGVRQGFEIALG